MNIPQRLPRYDIIENELKISTQDIRFHAVRRTLPQRVRDQLLGTLRSKTRRLLERGG